MQQQFRIGMNICQHIASSLFFPGAGAIQKVLVSLLTYAWCSHYINGSCMGARKRTDFKGLLVWLWTQLIYLLPFGMPRSLGKCCASWHHFLARKMWEFIWLFSIKNHLALNKRKKPLWCGEFFQQIQSDGAQLILLCKCNIDMAVTWNSDAPYSTKHLEIRLDLSIVNRSYENKPPVIKSK